MTIITYNVNGIRAALTKGLYEWIKAGNYDVVCLQEIKATKEQIPANLFEELGYRLYIHPATKKGYSGVAIFSKIEPIRVQVGCGIEKYDLEGRALRIDFENYSILNTYMPSGTSGDERQTFKYGWLADFQEYVNNLKVEIPNLIICGDYNICHRAIDIHNPKSNANSSGFLPAEREWMENFINSGFVDAFRVLNADPHHYTWWSYRAGARSKNLGWRIDYHLVSKTIEHKIKRAIILPEAKHSDHCPVLLEMEN